jgi:hypothetical protein
MDVPESLLLQAIDQLVMVARPFPNESSEWRAKNAQRVARELKACFDQQSMAALHQQPKPTP